MKNLRVVLFEECNRSCEGCCNKDWDFNKQPKVTDYRGYNKIILTGGEPMLRTQLVIDTCYQIKQQTDSPIILYTAKTKRLLDLVAILHCVEGLTVTLHEGFDAKPFKKLCDTIRKMGITGKSLRVNVFEGIDISDIDTSMWNVQEGYVWIENLALPDNEVLVRL